MERSPSMRRLAESLRGEWGGALPPPRVLTSLLHLRGVPQQRRYQLVVAAYSLGELSEEERRSTVRRLWAHMADDGVLVLVEPGTPRASEGLLLCREEVLRLERRNARQALKAGGDARLQVHILAPCPHESACPLMGTRSWCHFVQRVQRPPTQRLVKGATAAQPFQDERFSYVVLRRGARPQRLLALPDGREASVGSGSDELFSDLLSASSSTSDTSESESSDSDVDESSDELFDSSSASDASDSESSESDADTEDDSESEDRPPSEAAMLHARASADAGWARLMRPPRRRTRHVVLDLCTPAGLERRTVAESHARVLGPGSYAQARRARWGDCWPFNAV